MTPRALFATLLLCGLAVAQEQDAFDAAAELTKAKERLARLEKAESEEEQRFKDAVERRIAVLNDYLETERRKGELGDPGKLDARKSEVERQLAAQRGISAPASVTLASTDELARYEEPFKRAKAERDEKQAALGRARAQLSEADAELKKLPEEEATAKRLLEKLTGTDELAKYRMASANIRIRHLGLRREYLQAARTRWSALIPVLELEADLARMRYAVAEKAYQLAADDAARLRKSEAERAREEADREKEAAERARDPIERFRRSLAAESTRARSDERSWKNGVDALAAAIRERKTDIERLQLERTRLEQRLQLREDASADVLRGFLDRTRRSRRLFLDVLLPRFRAAADRYQGDLVATLDRLWELELAPDENQVLKELLAELPEDRHEEARRAFGEATQGADGLISALRDKRRVLENIDGLYGEAAGLNRSYLDELDRLEQFIVLRVYWLRSDPPLSFSPRLSFAEVKQVWSTFTSDRSLSQVTTMKGAVLLGGLIALLLVLFLEHRVRRRLERRAEQPLTRGGELWRRAIGLLLAAGPPAVLFVVAVLLDALRLPGEPYLGLPRLLRPLAYLLLIERASAWLLAPRGVAVRSWSMPEDVTRQVLRSIRLATIAGMLFYAPAEFLLGEPFGLVQVPRLLDTLWLVATALALMLLLRRRGALVGRITKPRSVGRRLWVLIGPLIGLGLLAIIAMDVAGYRVGARYLLLNAVRTVVAILLLVGVNLLSRLVIRKIAGVVRSRATAEEGAAAAWESASAVRNELARLVGLILTVIAFVYLASSWGLGGALVGALQSVRITEVSTDSWLTLWDIAIALLWIVGGHVVVRNLSTLYETLVFPLLGDTDRGGRFVVLALSRYVILVLGYSAAFLALGFSFSNLGWAFAAVSVGIGFGLQEIIANFVSGLILLFERPVRVGDVITVGETGGTVERINIRATTVVNWDRQTIVIPNKNFITQNLTNWTHNDRLMRTILPIGVAYGSDVERVLKVLEEETSTHPHVVKDPPHRIWFEGFAESYLDFKVWYFARLEHRLQTRTDLYRKIYARFAEEGIVIPFPQRDLHIKTISADPGLAASLEKSAEDGSGPAPQPDSKPS